MQNKYLEYSSIKTQENMSGALLMIWFTLNYAIDDLLDK